jgi:hypothetical protein
MLILISGAAVNGNGRRLSVAGKRTSQKEENGKNEPRRLRYSTGSSHVDFPPRTTQSDSALIRSGSVGVGHYNFF